MARCIRNAKAAPLKSPLSPAHLGAGALGFASLCLVTVYALTPALPDHVPGPLSALAPQTASTPVPEQAVLTTEPSIDPSAVSASAPKTAQKPEKNPAPKFDKSKHSTSAAESPWVVINKALPMEPSTYYPELTTVAGSQVATRVAAPLTELLDAAREAGHSITVTSAFRSVTYQRGIYDRSVALRGTTGADAVSARPGHSEHHTGLAVDLSASHGRCTLEACFSETAEGAWLAEHSWKHGFIVRYTNANSSISGYSAEPWHFRYVGAELAAELRSSKADSLEEFFGLPGGDYR